MTEENLVIPKIFTRVSRNFSDRVALQIKRDNQWQKFTYGKIQKSVSEVSAFLIMQGYKKGDCAGLILENRPEWGIIYLGIVQAGLSCVPLDPQLSPEEVKNLILDSNTKVIFCSAVLFVNKIKKIAEDCLIKSVVLDIEEGKDKSFHRFFEVEGTALDNISWPLVLADDIASLIYTSGTTGRPKGVLLSHKNICANFMSIQQMKLCSAADNFLSILPLYHSYAFMVTLIVPLFFGAQVTYCQSLKPEDLAGVIKEAGVSILVGVPQIFTLLHKAIFERIKSPPFYSRSIILPLIKFKLRRRFGNLRICVSGGARLEPKIGRDLCRLGLKVAEGYGLTETSPVVTLNPPEKIKFGSVGKALPDVQVSIFNPDALGIGEVLIKGSNVMQGYFKQPDLTNEVVKGGWFYSGDLGYLDKEGYLFLIGREKEVMVLASGKNIYPEELEAYYLQSPYIKEICIILKKEKIFGYLKDSLFAVIVPNLEYFAKKQETNIREKIHWDLETLGRRLAPYQHIMGFTLTKEELPRTALRKIKRYVVAEKYLPERAVEVETKKPVYPEGDLAFLNKEISRKIMQYIAKEVNKPVYLDSHLEIDLGIDSLGRVELGLGLEALFKIKIPDELLYSISTIRDVIINLENLIESKMPIAEKAREEGWPEILSAAPPKQIMEKIKIGFGIYESSITWLFNKAFLFIFRLFWFLRIEGRENLPYSGPYLICPNHASYLDGLFIFSSLPFEISMNTYFLGYQHIFEHPLLGWSNRVARFISIDVSSHLTEAMQAVAYVLGCKKMICIFPEGMRSIDTEVKEFKKGVGILMKELAIPVVPVCIQGSHGSWPRGSRFPRPYPVKVIFGRPFNWEELKKEGARLGARDDYEAISLGLRQEVVRLKEKP